MSNYFFVEVDNILERFKRFFSGAQRASSSDSAQPRLGGALFECVEAAVKSSVLAEYLPTHSREQLTDIFGVTALEQV